MHGRSFIITVTASAAMLLASGLDAATNYVPMTPGQRVLYTGRVISFSNRDIIKGSCWDFVNAVYTRAGYAEKYRTRVFSSSKQGPYADPSTILPGDWVAHINQEYGNVEHSAIFVRWIDKDEWLAETLDYAGMNREEPGKYRSHKMDTVYMIIRAKAQQVSGVK